MTRRVAERSSCAAAGSFRTTSTAAAASRSFTWQAIASIGHSFGWGDVVAAWRYIDHQMKSGKSVEEMNFNGPGVAAVFRWQVVADCIERSFTMAGTTGYLRLIRRIAGAAALLVAVALPQMAAAQSDKIDPQAVKLLKAATDFVASQKALAADTRNTLEVVLTSGQKIQFAHTAKLSMQRPNKLRAERTGDLVNQVFYYDGKSLTLSNPGEKYYATVAAPPTLEEMLNFARSSLDIIAPAGDLLYRNAYDILMTDVSSGFVVGKGIVEGVRCDHLAFRAPHVDWQIWIEDGARPLPRKLVITTRDVVNAPQFAVVVTRWDLQPKQTDGMFTFTPSKDAKRVEFLPPVGGKAGR